MAMRQINSGSLANMIAPFLRPSGKVRNGSNVMAYVFETGVVLQRGLHLKGESIQGFTDTGAIVGSGRDARVVGFTDLAIDDLLALWRLVERMPPGA